jgi:hypothetical protein
MKKIILTIITVCIIINVFGQGEIKVNALGFLFGNYGVTYEHPMSDKVGLECILAYRNARIFELSDLIVRNEGVNAKIIGKLYLDNEKPNESWFINAYACAGTSSYFATVNPSNKLNNTSAGLGFGAGHKWLFDEKFVVESGFGMGKLFINNYSFNVSPTIDLAEFGWLFSYDFYVRLSFGYRIDYGKL